MFPEGSKWIWNHFMYIWQNADTKEMTGRPIITFRTLNDYEECMKVRLSIKEKKQILLMKHWAYAAISELEDKK